MTTPPCIALMVRLFKSIRQRRRLVCAFLAFLFALCGLFAVRIEEGLADDKLPSSSLVAMATVDGDPCIYGQAIACIASDSETQLSQVADSVEFLVALDEQSSGCGPCDLVLVKSSSRTVEDLVAALEACENVQFAEPNYLGRAQEEDVADPEGDAAGQEEDVADSEGDADQQVGTSLMGASDTATRSDYTDRQYAFNGEFGIGVPGWNTYDSAGNPTPSVSTAGKVVAVIDSGVDYAHEDLPVLCGAKEKTTQLS